MIFFIIPGICFCIDGFSQVVRGRVLEINTNKPVDLASVYFNGTLYGTNSDQNGNFQIEIPQGLSYPLVISSIGYYSVTLLKFSSDTSLLVYLTPKAYILKEVIITPMTRMEKRQRARDLLLFRNQFLGETPNAEKCVITNERDLKFKYDSDNKTLNAFCSQPLIIKNYALGYSIKYYLDKFEYCESENSLLIIGNYIFIEDTTLSKKLAVKSRREEAYYGSRMHFFRMLWENKMELQDYTIVDSSGFVLAYDQLVKRCDETCKPDDAYMIYKGDIYVIYKYSPDKGNSNRKSLLNVDSTVYFDKNGYFDPYPISWQGNMARRRIGDLLPFEYRQK